MDKIRNLDRDRNLIRAAIRRELERRGWSVTRLAEDPALAGRVSRAMVHEYLSGRHDLSTERASVLLELLGLAYLRRHIT